MLGAGSPNTNVLVGVRSDFSADQVSPALLALSEAEFQRMVIAGLEQRGYAVTTIPDMRKTRAGWPDLVFFHPRFPGRLYCWELKREGKHPTQKQRDTLAALGSVAGIDVRVVRPSDWLKHGDEVAPAPTGRRATGEGEVT